MSSSVQDAVNAEELMDPAPKPIRRSFTTEYRHQVVAEYEAAPHGEALVTQSRAASARRS